GEGALHGLADPPRAVGAELESAAVLVLLHRAYQPQVAFLNQIAQLNTAFRVLASHGNDQPQVRFDETFARFVDAQLALLDGLLQAWRLAVPHSLRELGQLLLGLGELPRELALVPTAGLRDAADLGQVRRQRFSRSPSR